MLPHATAFPYGLPKPPDRRKLIPAKMRTGDYWAKLRLYDMGVSPAEIRVLDNDNICWVSGIPLYIHGGEFPKGMQFGGGLIERQEMDFVYGHYIARNFPMPDRFMFRDNGSCELHLMMTADWMNRARWTPIEFDPMGGQALFYMHRTDVIAFIYQRHTYERNKTIW